MTSRFLSLLAGASVLTLAAPAFADGALTADEAARRAVSTSPDVAARTHAAAAAEAHESQTKDAWIPTITGGASYFRLSPMDAPSIAGLVFPIPVNQTEAHATLDVPLSDYILRVPEGVSASSNEAEASHQDETTAKLRAVETARVAYWQWLRARGALVVAEQARDAAQKHVTDAEAALRAGTVAPADRSRAESLAREADLAVERTRSAVTNGEAALRVAMHDSWKGPLEPGEILVETEAAGPDVAPLADLVARAQEARTEMRALAAHASALASTASLTRAALFPKIDAVASASYANPNYRIIPPEDKFLGSWQVGAVLSWTPTDLPGVIAGARVVDEKREALLADRASLGEAIRLEVTHAWTALREARVAIVTTAQRRTAADDAYRARVAQFQAGRATFVELADSLTDLTRARLESIDAHAEERIARIRLARATGEGAVAAN